MRKVWIALSVVLVSVATVMATAAEPPKDVESSKEEVHKAIEALRPQAPGLINPGEFAYFETVRSVESSPEKLLAQDAFSVLSKYENQTNYRFMIRQEHHQIINGQYNTTVREYPVVIEKDMPALMPVSLLSAMSGAGDYYNLIKSESVLPTPKLILARKDCGGLKGCPKELKTQVVDFDYDDFDMYGKFSRTHYTYWGTPEVPYMSSPMKSCAVGPFYANGYELKATECLSIKDFEFGR